MRQRWTRRAGAGLGLAALLYLGVFAAIWIGQLAGDRTIEGLRVEHRVLSPTSDPARALGPFAERLLDQHVTLGAGDGRTFSMRRRDLGYRIDLGAFARRLLAVGRSGNPLADLYVRRRARAGRIDLPLPMAVDPAAAMPVLVRLKDELDVAALNARLEFATRTATDHRDGRYLDAYATIEALDRAGAGRVRARTVDLVLRAVPPRFTRDFLSTLDTSAVLGEFSTEFPTTRDARDRAFNVALAASKLDGVVVMPGELFSFNDVVGERSERAGFKNAPVIFLGEMVEGTGGGTCQVASTVHAAGFFAALEIVDRVPHSRPSPYVAMGLDSTVAWPLLDLKLRNPYDFPIVLHTAIGRNHVRAQFLGPRRPNTVAFQREVLDVLPNDRTIDEDPGLSWGQSRVLQRGIFGYRIRRSRYILLPDGRVRTERQVDRYPPTTEIVRLGTRPPPEGVEAAAQAMLAQSAAGAAPPAFAPGGDPTEIVLPPPPLPVWGPREQYAPQKSLWIRPWGEFPTPTATADRRHP